jgi:hypothetical protein
MQTVNIGLLATLAAELPEDSIKVLSDSSTTMHRNMTKVFNNPLYWKGRTEVLLHRHIKNRNVNWQEIYNIFTAAIQGKNLQTEGTLPALVVRYDGQHEIDITTIEKINVENEGDLVMFNLITQNNEYAVSIYMETGYNINVRHRLRKGELYITTDPLIKAVLVGNIKIVELLLNYNEYNPSHTGSKAIIRSVNMMDIMKLIMNHPRINPAANNNKLIVDASKRNLTELVLLLLENPKVDPSTQNNTVFNLCRNGNTLVVDLLLHDPRINPADQQNDAFINACRGNNRFESGKTHNSNMDTIKLLLDDDRINPADQNNQAFIEACSSMGIKIVKLLLNDPRINPADQNNQAFIEACAYGSGLVVMALLYDYRINPADQNNKAFIKACYKGETQHVVMLLKDRRINPSDQQNEAFIRACVKGNSDIVKLLLRDIRINPADQNNKALHKCLALLEARAIKRNKMLMLNIQNVVNILLSDTRVVPL